MAVTINGTTGIVGVDGSVSTPAVQGTDTNTGIYFPAADTIAFTEGGVESMRITSAGEVLVGGTTAIGATSGNVTIEGITGGNINLYRNDTTVTTNNLLGNVSFYGNDTTSNTPTQLAAVQARASGDHATGDNPTDLVFYTTPDGSATVTEVVRFNQAGNVGIGTNSPSYKLTLSGTGAQTISLNSTDTGTGALGLIQLSDDLSLYRGSEGGSGISRSILLDAAATNGTVKFNTAGSERMRIASTGELLVGGSTVLPEPYSGGGAPKLNVEGTGGAYLALFRNDTVVASPNPIGDISFYGNDTTSNTPTRLAYISALAAGTHAAGDNPTDLVFGTTDVGSATVTERMRIDSNGSVEIGTVSGLGFLNVQRNGAGIVEIARFANINASTGHRLAIAVDDDSNLAYYTSTGASSGGHVFRAGGTEVMSITSGGNLEFNSGYGSVATAYGCRAWVNFNGSANTNLSGTYSQSGTTVTVTAAAHGLIAGNVVYSDITSGTGVDGTYTVATVTSSSVFTYTAGTSLTTSGNVTLLRNTIRASGNVSSITDNGTGDYTINFTTSMPDSNYSVVALGNTGSNNGYMTVISTASGNCNIVTRTSAAIGPDGTIICAAVFR